MASSSWIRTATSSASWQPEARRPQTSSAARCPSLFTATAAGCTRPLAAEMTHVRIRSAVRADGPYFPHGMVVDLARRANASTLSCTPSLSALSASAVLACFIRLVSARGRLGAFGQRSVVAHHEWSVVGAPGGSPRVANALGYIRPPFFDGLRIASVVVADEPSMQLRAAVLDDSRAERGERPDAFLAKGLSLLVFIRAREVDAATMKASSAAARVPPRPIQESTRVAKLAVRASSVRHAKRGSNSW